MQGYHVPITKIESDLEDMGFRTDGTDSDPVSLRTPRDQAYLRREGHEARTAAQEKGGRKEKWRLTVGAVKTAGVVRISPFERHPHHNTKRKGKTNLWIKSF